MLAQFGTPGAQLPDRSVDVEWKLQACMASGAYLTRGANLHVLKQYENQLPIPVLFASFSRLSMENLGVGTEVRFSTSHHACFLFVLGGGGERP